MRFWELGLELACLKYGGLDCTYTYECVHTRICMSMLGQRLGLLG